MTYGSGVPVNTYGMLNDIGNNFRAGQERNRQNDLWAQANGAPAQPPGFFARILGGENPFAQAVQPQPGASPSVANAAAGTGIGVGATTESYIRQAAIQRGIDPDTAVSVAKSEGLNSYAGDSNSSFGPFQLHYGGVASGGNAVSGLGDEFTAATGLNARNPATTRQQIDFALDHAANNGWGAFHGAANSGVGEFQGISKGGRPTLLAGSVPSPNTVPANGGVPDRLNMTLAPGSTGPSGVPTVGSGATTTPMGQNLLLPNASVATLGELANGRYGEMAKLALQQRMQQGQLSYHDIPVAGSDGTMIGTRPAFVSSDGGVHFVQGAAIDTTKMKEGNQANYQVIGEDQYGRKQYGYPPKPGEQPTAPAAPAQADAMNLHGPDFMATLPPNIQSQVKAIVEGRAPYPTGMLLKTPYGQQLAQYVTQTDPTFESGNATARVASRKEFETGGPNSVAGTITAGNAAIQHLGEASNAAEKLSTVSSGSLGPLTGMLNSGINAYQSGKQAPEVSNFNNIIARFGEEATKFYRGIGGSEADVQRDIANLSPTMSPDQLRGAIQTQVRLMTDKIQALQTRWNTAMGPMVPDFPIISGKTQGVIDKIGGRATLGGAPQGTSVAVPGTQATQQTVPSDGSAGGGFTDQPMEKQKAAIIMLRKNPALAPDLDAKFGLGTSDRILGRKGTVLNPAEGPIQ